MVGEAEDVQSFDKRDGSHLELFDCPDTHPDDFSVQKARAVCVGGTDSKNNCEEILLGGVEGTVVRMPTHCGPDDYVRAVRFDRSDNLTLPTHLQKRSSSSSNYKVYEFHYDYNFQNLRRNGGEVYFRADLSSHPGFWDKVVAAAPGSNIKRSADNWRDLDRRYWSDKADDWLKRFNDLLVQGNTGLKKHYSFNQCLVDAYASCGAHADAKVKASVYGELNTTMDLGMTLIGTLRNFGFSESYSFFNQESFSMRMGAEFQARARLYFDSGWAPVGSFDSFGMNAYIKGIFTINPYFQVDARLEADAYVSATATVETTISNERFRYYLPANLAHNPTSINGDFGLSTVTGPISGFGNIEARAGGGLVFGFRPTIGVDIGLHFRGEQYVNTSIKLSTPGSIRFDAALSTSCSNGMQFDVIGQLDVDFAVDNALPGWSSKSYTWKDTSPKTIFSDCVPFSVLARRDLDKQVGVSNLAPRSPIAPRLSVPHATTHTCAFAVDGLYCADGNDDPTPNCDLNSLPPEMSDDDDDDDDDDEEDGQGTFSRRDLLQKRNDKSAGYCDNRGGRKFEGFGNLNQGKLVFSDYPSSTELVRKYYPNVATYDAEDTASCTNLNLTKLSKTPQNPMDKSSNNGRDYHSEHVLEAQTLQRFFNYVGQMYSNTNNGIPANPLARKYTSPKKGDNNVIPWCEYMRYWWQDPQPFSGNKNANKVLANVYPGYNWHFTEEFVLYESVLNSQIKNRVSVNPRSSLLYKIGGAVHTVLFATR